MIVVATVLQLHFSHCVSKLYSKNRTFRKPVASSSPGKESGENVHSIVTIRQRCCSLLLSLMRVCVTKQRRHFLGLYTISERWMNEWTNEWMNGWMNEYGASVEWHRANRSSVRNLSQCPTVHHKSHMVWPGIKPRASAVRIHNVFSSLLSNASFDYSLCQSGGAFLVKAKVKSLSTP
jgi:hypothetical protein